MDDKSSSPAKWCAATIRIVPEYLLASTVICDEIWKILDASKRTRICVKVSTHQGFLCSFAGQPSRKGYLAALYDWVALEDETKLSSDKWKDTIGWLHPDDTVTIAARQDERSLTRELFTTLV